MLTTFASKTFAGRSFAALLGARGVVTVLYRAVRIGDVTQVTVTTILASPVYYFWYLDGRYVGMTTIASRTFSLPSGDQLRLVVLASNDPDFDPLAAAPLSFPSTRTLFWIRSLSASVDHYQIREQKNSEPWIVLANVPAVGTQWSYAFQTETLDDLATYSWQIIPVDRYGNEGAPLVTDPELIVRQPDAPAFTASLDQASRYLTVSA